MTSLSRQLPDFYPYYENETQFYLRQMRYRRYAVAAQMDA